MLKLLCISAVVLQLCLSMQIGKRDDDDDYILVCTQEPIDLAIILDSSSSIAGKDFDTGIRFVQNFLSQFTIGSGPNDVRVAMVSYGKGVYTQYAFNLTTYDTKEGVLDAVGRIKHMFGLWTGTDEAIEYMRTVQMNPSVTRDWAEQVCIVITDGDSQMKEQTRDQAALAREQGINMFALGIGRVRDTELLNIAGDRSRVMKVANYDELEGIKEQLAKETCIKKPRPTTTQKPKTDDTCAEDFPSDINFVFSPEDLGTRVTSWITNVIEYIVLEHDFTNGFRYGLVTGSCPEDEGFRLNEYSTTDEIVNRLRSYARYRLPGLIQRTTSNGFTTSNGGRPDARDVAVVFVDGNSPDNSEVELYIQEMLAKGVMVYVIDPYDTGVEFPGAITIRGQSSREVGIELVNHLCEWGTYVTPRTPAPTPPASTPEPTPKPTPEPTSGPTLPPCE